MQITGSIKRLLACIAAIVMVAACVPLPGNSNNYQYEIDLTANGRHYTFQQYFVCYQQADLSEADMTFHRRTHASGTGITTADIGDGLVLLFQVGECVGEQKELPRVASVLVDPLNPRWIYPVNGVLKEPSIVINHVTVKPVQRIERELGPTTEQIALKNLLREHQSGFQRVTARIIPREVWATSDQSRAYFGQFHSVTEAKVGEAPPVSGWPDSFVQFKFWRERTYQKGSLGQIVGLKEIELAYNGEAFEIPGHITDPLAVWYATPKTQKDHPNTNNAPEFAVVTHKGALIKVKTLQEIFDPETQDILLLHNHYQGYPWGGPDDIDVKRIMVPKK